MTMITTSTLNSTETSLTTSPVLGFTTQTPVSPEEITTLFIVGFPDDTQEREFLNMFTFAHGFEAATLKVPSLLYTPPEDDMCYTGMGSQRRQIIGFAKFRTKSDAQEAREVLNGRVVDMDKGFVLKVELAKKNLHTRRPVEPPGIFCPNTQIAFNSITYPPLSIYRTNSTKQDFENALYTGSTFEQPGYFSHDDRFCDPFAYMSSAGEYDQKENQSTTKEVNTKSTHQMGELDELSRSCISEVLDDPGVQMPIAKPVNTAVQASLNLSSTSVTMPLPSPAMNDLFGSRGGFESALYHNLNMAESSTFPNSSQSSSDRSPVFSGNLSFIPSFLPSLAQSNISRVGVSNDQNNPPCNTLYVGNLPCNASEEELRCLFLQCIGFKRMLFRSKTNGPMCFVEFECVGMATQAMQSLHGHHLSTSTKGGIRLSFSKNPLGVRSANSFMFPAMGYGMYEDEGHTQ